MGNELRCCIRSSRSGATDLNLWADLEKMAQFKERQGLFPAAR